MAFPETVIVRALTRCPFVGLVMFTFGAVTSILTVRITGLEVEILPMGS